MNRVCNFSAGPSVLPEWVLKKAASEMIDYNGSGESVMEMSHRSPEFMVIIQDTEKRLRDVLNIPSNYKVLFLQGGASTQFAMIPLNLMIKNEKADYITTGQWSKKAFAEAKKYGNVREVASSADKVFSYIPDVDQIKFDPSADYVHITYNNTIYGTKYNKLPNIGNVPLVSDVSSFILSEPLDISKFGLLYAGAQKNMGPAGLTVVIIREDLVLTPQEATPTMLTYKTHVDNGSMYNTPPCYAIYICGLVLRWIQEEVGGLEKMKEINEKKAAILYDFLDSSSLFKATAEPSSRSLMNIPFVTKSADLDKKFIEQSKISGFINLKGHRSVGGMRASIYNAMPIECVKKLVNFMEKFEKENA